MKKLFIVLIFIGFIVACQNAKNDEATADPGKGHDHGALPILLFSDGMELFAEADQLFEQHEVEIRAHLTFLKDYSPAKKGQFYARISKDQIIPLWIRFELTQPGIFTGIVRPEVSGDAIFEFKYEEENLEVYFTLEPVRVYTHDEDPPEAEHIEGLSYTKEQAWQTTFGLMPIGLATFSEAINCGGEVELSSGSEYELVAPASGTIHFANNAPGIGQFVKKGTVLFYVLPTGTGDENLELELVTAKSEYEKAKADFLRKEELVKEEAVSAKVFEEARSAYKIAGSRYEILQSQLSESGIVVRSPISGYITEFVAKGSGYARAGDLLLKLIKEDGLLIKANVPSMYTQHIEHISSANFKVPGESKIFSIEDFDGKLLSRGRTLEANSGMIPVYFSGNFSHLIPGTFVELWLLCEPLENQLLVPKTSLLEEYGSYYVCVQIGGETYEKRKVGIAGYDGFNYLISSGLTVGEIIVSKGVMAVKIANAIGTPPAHTH